MFLSKKSLILCAMLLNVGLGGVNAVPVKVLCINQTGGYTHTTAIRTLTGMLQDLATQKGFTLVVPANAAATQAQMNDDSLRAFQVIIFNNNNSIGGVITDANQRAAFQRWLKHGGGLVGWHGVMDHSDLWPWLTDSVFSGTKLIDHSPWNANSDRNAQVRVDTIPTQGAIRDQKDEYKELVAGFPKGQWTWPDEWMDLRSNPRDKGADILLTIDETTYTPPTKMGPDHPIAWAYTLPPDSAGKVGRYIFNARGHDVGAYDGTSTNAAPNGVDTCSTGLTRNWAWQSIRWAAGLTQSTTIMSVKTNAYKLLNTRNENGVLKITVNAVGKHVVEVFDLSGQRLNRQTGEGVREYSFLNLKHNAVYLIRVSSSNKTQVQRVLL